MAGRVLVHALGGALAPPSLTFESCVCTRVCVHTYGLTLAQADGIHTNRSRRPGGVCVTCERACVCVWVMGVLGGASAPPIRTPDLNIHPEAPETPESPAGKPGPRHIIG